VVSQNYISSKMILTRIAVQIGILWLRTLRVNVIIPPTPSIIALWHRDLPVCIRAFSNQNIHVMISASSDGLIAQSICKKFRYQISKGSGSRYSYAVRKLLSSIYAGTSVGMALDGPRGPAGTIHPGVIWLYQKTKAPLYLVTVNYPVFFKLKSWDQTRIPMPFSKVDVQLIRLDHSDLVSQLQTEFLAH
jgi:lysophospholipid acyltransferase (LPLAT)-like uncharacterized protein